MAHQVQIIPRANRDLDRLSRPIQIRLLRAIHALGEEPRPEGCVKLAGDDNLWRIRLGDYRVVYEIHDDRLIVLVLRMGHRKDIYR